MPWGLTLSFSPPCWKENLRYSFQRVCQKRTKVCPTKKTNFSPLLKRKSLIFFSASATKKCLSRLYKFVYKFCQQNFYIQICVLSIESVTKICQTNVYKFVHKIGPEFITKICPQILSTRSANLSTIITNLFQSVYSVSRNLSTKESTNL